MYSHCRNHPCNCRSRTLLVQEIDNSFTVIKQMEKLAPFTFIKGRKFEGQGEIDNYELNQQ